MSQVHALRRAVPEDIDRYTATAGVYACIPQRVARLQLEVQAANEAVVVHELVGIRQIHNGRGAASEAAQVGGVVRARLKVTELLEQALQPKIALLAQ